MSPKFTFDEDTHTYRLESGVIVPSVTQVIAAAGLYDASVYPEGAASFGNNVHAACELWDLFGEETVDPGVIPYLNAWRGFRNQKTVKFTEIEHMKYHEGLGYAGTVDRFGADEKSNIVIDIKSGRKEPWHSIQSSAYANMYPQPHLIQRWCVYLRPDETYMVDVHPKSNFTQDLNVFLACLSVYNWRIRHGKF